MRRILALLAAALLLFPAALADGAAFPATQALLDEMMARDALCLLEDMDKEGREWAVMQVSDNTGRSWDVRFGFDQEGSSCILRVPGFIRFHGMEIASVLRVCNALNAEYRYVRFHVEEEACTVTATMYLRFHDAAPGPLTAQAYETLTAIIIDAYPQLVEFHLR